MKESALRILLFGDTHLGYDHSFQPRIQRRRRGPDFLENFYRVLSYARKEGVDLLVHGGDLFFRSKIPKRLIPLVYDPLLELAETGLPIFLIPGNHERSRFPTPILLAHPNIHVFAEPSTHLAQIKDYRILLAGFPFWRSNLKDNFRNLLAATGWQKEKADLHLLCLHQIFRGAQVEGYTFRGGPDVVSQKWVPDQFQAVLSGHIHRFQVLPHFWACQRYCPPVIYPGSTERTSFMEKSEVKGFCVLHFIAGFNGLQLQNINFVPLPTRPMLDIHIPAQFDNTVDLGDLVRKELLQIPKDAIVRLKLPEGMPSWATDFLTSRRLRALSPATMNVQLQRPRLESRSLSEVSSPV